MTPSLAELQSSFSDALHYRSKGDECGVASDNFTADERMQIYRNNFIMGLTEILSISYPLTFKIVGEECFNGLARAHILANPLASADVSLYGREFENTIKQTNVVMQAVPYLAEVARFEWSADTSVQISNQLNAAPKHYPFSHLSTIDPSLQSQIILYPQLSMQFIQSDYAIFSIQNAIKTDNFDDLDIEIAEQGVIYSPNGHYTALEQLTENEYYLLQHLADNRSLGEIDPSLLSSLDRLMQLQLFIGFDIKKDEELIYD